MSGLECWLCGNRHDRRTKTVWICAENLNLKQQHLLLHSIVLCSPNVLIGPVSCSYLTLVVEPFHCRTVDRSRCTLFASTATSRVRLQQGGFDSETDKVFRPLLRCRYVPQKGAGTPFQNVAAGRSHCETAPATS